MVDGGLAQVYEVCPDASDAGPAVELDGGTWVLPPPRGPRLACKLSGCEEYVRQFETPVPMFSQAALMLALVVGIAGVLVGGVGLWAIERWFGWK